MDSARWDGFELRGDDIIVTTPSKCGTTWMQMCCLVLVHGSPTLPGSLSELAPWLDQVLSPVEEIHDRFASQQHRRVIKTHTPLDGLPWDPRVTYIGVGRDPRDVTLSLASHLANMDMDVAIRARAELGLPEAARLPRPTEPKAMFDHFVEDESRVEEFRAGLNSLVHHLEQVWRARHEPNVALFHYSDLRADLAGEMQRLAEVLGVPIDEAVFPELVAAATFASMKEGADRLAPNADKSLWHSNERFFAEGRLGGWRALLSAEALERYDRRLAGLTDDGEFVVWLHAGSGECTR